jgi:L-iditol 2-dehydrogenase
MTARVAAAVMTAPRVPLELREFPEPELADNSVLLRTLHSEVCGTDVHLHHGRLAGVPYPIIPGHVSIGVVAKLRGAVRSGLGEPVREGDVVTFLDVHGTCYNCYYCLVADQPTRCASRRVYGITLSATDGLLGGWSQAIYLKPGVKIVHTPKELTPETYIGGGCGLVTALHAVDMARIRLGESVAVMGVGPVGQSAVALASISGAGEIAAVDGVPGRLQYAREMGATAAISLETPRADRLAQARALTGGRGFDVVIEASGSPDAVSEALDVVRDGGRVVVCGHYTDNGAVEIHPHWQINRKHVELRGCWGSRYEHFQRAVDIAARFGHAKPWSRMIGGRYPLEKINDALAAVEDRSAIKVLVTP